MKNKKLNIIKLILANILILLVMILVMLLTPNRASINFVIYMIYICFSVLFNMFITEGDDINE